MSYFGSTQLSSVANPPRQLVAPFANNPSQVGVTAYMTSQGSTATYAKAPGGGGGGLWFYSSTNLTTDLTAANFFNDGYYLGMRAGDVVMGNQLASSAGSSVVTFTASVVSVSTSGASLSTGSFITSTFN